MVREINFKKNGNFIHVDLDKYIELDQWRKFCHGLEKERGVEELHLQSEISGLGKTFLSLLV